MEKKLLKSAEVARHLRVSRTTINRWAEEGLIPSIAAGKRMRRFILEEVLRALEKIQRG